MIRMIFWTLSFVILGVVNGEAKIRVVTTTTDLAAIVSAVGGNEVDVEAIAKGYQDPHYVQAKPSYMRMMNRADLLVYVGMELEVGWLPLLIQGARNPRIAPGAVGHLDASVGIRHLEVPTGQVDRSMGDVHPDGNPHYWLNPRNGLVIAKRVAEKLGDLEPEKADVFLANYETFRTDLEAHIVTWKKKLAQFEGRELVTYHKLWAYLADWLQFVVVDQVESKAGIPPSPRHLSDLVARMKSEQIDLVVCSNFVDTKIAQRVADRSQARLIVLPASVGAVSGVETYVGLFDHIVGKLESVNGGSDG